MQHNHFGKYSQTTTTSTQVGPAPTTRSGPLLFVHRDQDNVRAARTTKELEQIKRHLAQRHQKKGKGQRKLDVHPSVDRILREPLNHGVDHDNYSAHGEAVSLTQTGDRHALLAAQGSFVSFTESSIRSALNANIISDGILDPFTPFQESTSEIRRLLFLYCRHLRPLAGTVDSEWNWIESVGKIQSSPMLTYAVAAYASAFFTGLKSGSRGIALPPVPEKGRQSLWDMPTWFRFQTQALASLNIALLDREQLARSQVYHTIVFLFRLAVLFGDGMTANMHYKALRQVAQLQGPEAEDISRELAVTKVNFITVFLYKGVLIKKKRRAITQEQPRYTIEPDQDWWTDETEWNKFQGMLFCRSLTWNARSPGSLPQTDARRNILRLDPIAARLSDTVFSDMVRMYQTALYLWTYLTSIAFESSSPKIRLHFKELEQYLRQPEIERTEVNAPRVVFLLFFVGALSSRGFAVRKWFIDKLAESRIQIWYMSDIYAELDGHCDPMHCVPVLLEEVLMEIRQAREANVPISKRDLYQGTSYHPARGPTPMSYSPDLETPIRDLETSE